MDVVVVLGTFAAIVAAFFAFIHIVDKWIDRIDKHLRSALGKPDDTSINQYLEDLRRDDFKDIYKIWLTKKLNILKEIFGYGEKTRVVTIQGLFVSFGLSVIYTVLFFIFGWIFFGTATLGDRIVIETDAPWLRLLLITAFGLIGYIAWKHQRLDKRGAVFLWRWLPARRARALYRWGGTLLVVAVYLGLLEVLIDQDTNWMNWRVLVLVAGIIFLGAWVGVAFTFAFAFTLAITGTVTVTVTRIVVGVETLTLALTLALALTVVVVVAGARFINLAEVGATIGAVFVAFTVFVIFYFQDGMTINFFTILLFLVVLPMLNGLADWVSWMISRALGHGLLRRRSLGAFLVHVGLDLLAAMGLLAVMALFVGVGTRTVDLMGRGTEAHLFDAGVFLATAWNDPWGSGFWVVMMMFTTLLPTALHAGFVVTGLYFLEFRAGRRTRCIELLEGQPSARDLTEVARYIAWRGVSGWLVSGVLFFGLVGIAVGAVPGLWEHHLYEVARAGVRLIDWAAGAP